MTGRKLFDHLAPIMQNYSLGAGDNKNHLIPSLRKLCAGKVDAIPAHDLWEMWDALGLLSRSKDQQQLYVALGVLSDLRRTKLPRT